MEKPTPRQRRVLWLIAELTGPEDPSGPLRFVKESSIQAFFFRASHEKLLPYDTAPVLTLWHGDTRYVQLSQEGQEDLTSLEGAGFLQRLELSSIDQDLFSAYRITPRGRAAAELEPAASEKMAELTKCSCGGALAYLTSRERAWRRCTKCGKETDISCLDFPSIPYRSKAHFPSLITLQYRAEDCDD